jgi:hypothetical protein
MVPVVGGTAASPIRRESSQERAAREAADLIRENNLLLAEQNRLLAEQNQTQSRPRLLRQDESRPAPDWSNLTEQQRTWLGLPMDDDDLTEEQRSWLRLPPGGSRRP